jgi:hypothetical protein
MSKTLDNYGMHDTGRFGGIMIYGSDWLPVNKTVELDIGRFWNRASLETRQLRIRNMIGTN